jgi:uncharacterized protein (TIGR00251 family)
VSLAVWVTPGARRNELTGIADGRLRVRLAAAPVEGRANEALVRFLAESFHVRRDAVTVVAGARARRKLLHIAGVTLAEAKRRLAI